MKELPRHYYRWAGLGLALLVCVPTWVVVIRIGRRLLAGF